MSDSFTDAQLMTIILRFQLDREAGRGPRLPEGELRLQVEEAARQIEATMAGQPFYQKFLALHRRARELTRNPLAPAQK